VTACVKHGEDKPEEEGLVGEKSVLGKTPQEGRKANKKGAEN